MPLKIKLIFLKSETVSKPHGADPNLLSCAIKDHHQDFEMEDFVCVRKSAKLTPLAKILADLEAG